MIPRLTATLIIFQILFFIPPPTILAQEVEDESGFDYRAGSKKGPSNWGKLNKAWAACNNGAMQSPIDLTDERVRVIPNAGRIPAAYHPCNASIMNRGHDISVKWMGDAGSLQINGTTYYLHQLHWHSPSEHAVNGKKYALELHLVHLTTDPKAQYKFAVVGLFFRPGRSDPFLGQLGKYMMQMVNQKTEKYTGVLDPREIDLGGEEYYRYIGSLTVPPCTEGVIWTIGTKVKTVSRDQVLLLRMAVHDYAETNARPLQPLHQREIKFFRPNPLPIN